MQLELRTDRALERRVKCVPFVVADDHNISLNPALRVIAFSENSATQAAGVAIGDLIDRGREWDRFGESCGFNLFASLHCRESTSHHFSHSPVTKFIIYFLVTTQSTMKSPYMLASVALRC
jgi:hypothetical protein